MRIVHVISSLDPVLGGPPVVAAHLAAAQAALGHEVHVLSYPSASGAERLRETLAGIRQFRLVQHDLLPMPGRVELLLAGAARREMRRYLPGFDVVHIHAVWDGLAKGAADVARRHRVCYVVAPHGMLDPWSMSQGHWKKRIALALGYRRMLEEAAFLHVLNPDERDLLRPLGLRCPLEVIPNGVAMENFQTLPPKDEFQRSHPELRGQPYILFLSRLHHKKGLDYLASAFAVCAKSNQQVHLVVAGPDHGARGALESQVEGAGLRQRVHIVGPLYGNEKLAALAGASCFCLPSRQEGFSMAIAEAMACGVPVVASEGCHFPELAECGAGSVVKLDDGQIAEALVRIVGDGAMQKRMGEAGRRLIESRYTWPVIGERSIEAYRSWIGAAGRR